MKKASYHRLLASSEKDEAISNYPNCNVYNTSLIGNGICDEWPYNTEECGWDDGDCTDFNEKYQNCPVDFPSWVGDGKCDGWPYNTERCNWDGGDCFIENYPDCHVGKPSKLGDGKCDGRRYNTKECGWDDGDCLEFNSKYPNCTLDVQPFKFGDGKCTSHYNSEDCGFDDGDCIEFNSKYPNCTAYYPEQIGNGYCESYLNTTECGYDEGDCLDTPPCYNCNRKNPPELSTIVLIVLPIVLLVFYAWDVCRRQDLNIFRRQQRDSSTQQNMEDTRFDRHTLVLTSIIHKKVYTKDKSDCETNDISEISFPHESIISQRSSRILSSIDKLSENIEEGGMSKDNIMVKALRNDASSEENFSSNPKICPICCEEYKKGDDIAWSKNEKCIHAFHTDCIVSWLMNHSDCPMCRNDYLCLE